MQWVLTVIFPLLSLLTGLWWATQWTARLLRYAPALGRPWLHLGAWILYRPWDVVGWYLRWSPGRAWAFTAPVRVVLTSIGVALVCAWTGRLWRHRQTTRPTTFGSSHWATWQAVQRSGLLRPQGVMLG